jgi:hypothetical protein
MDTPCGLARVCLLGLYDVVVSSDLAGQFCRTSREPRSNFAARPRWNSRAQRIVWRSSTRALLRLRRYADTRTRRYVSFYIRTIRFDDNQTADIQNSAAATDRINPPSRYRVVDGLRFCTDYHKGTPSITSFHSREARQRTELQLHELIRRASFDDRKWNQRPIAGTIGLHRY